MIELDLHHKKLLKQIFKNLQSMSHLSILNLLKSNINYKIK